MATEHLERFISKRLRILTAAGDSMSASSELPVGLRGDWLHFVGEMSEEFSFSTEFV